MSETVTNELMYDILKQIREDVSHVRCRVEGQSEQFKDIQHRLAALHGGNLRRESAIAGVRVELEAIRHRLG